MENKKKSTYIKIMCTPEEKEKIQNNANGNVSDFIRNLALNNKRIRVKEAKADPLLVEQVRRAGVSLNQLARAVNSHIKSDKHIELAQVHFYLKACNENLERIIAEATADAS
ncbi:plasmid mobilization relaxosome protein MobC [Vibrio alginolyticus]|jgi:hypothetical protein|nr:plasmid mobilization relaxosome protein MobC [Vibrio alginolyticus]